MSERKPKEARTSRRSVTVALPDLTLQLPRLRAAYPKKRDLLIVLEQQCRNFKKFPAIAPKILWTIDEIEGRHAR